MEEGSSLYVKGENMVNFFNYIRFQFLYWKLTSRFRDGDDWIINEESISLIKRCFQLIQPEHFKRLNRRYLQTISVVSYTGGLVPWLNKCEYAVDNLITSGLFPDSWGYLPEPLEMSLSSYLSSDDYWREPREIIIQVIDNLERIELLIREGGELNASYRLRKLNKLISEPIGYLASLLFLYRENQYYVKKKRR